MSCDDELPISSYNQLPSNPHLPHLALTLHWQQLREGNMRPASFPCSWSVPCSCFRRIIAGFMMEKSTLVSAGTLRILPKGGDCTDLLSGFVELFRLVYLRGRGSCRVEKFALITPCALFPFGSRGPPLLDSLGYLILRNSWTSWSFGFSPWN